MSDASDARCLSPSAQEAPRRRALRAIREEGMSKSEAARTFGVSRTSIHAWLNKFTVRGAAGLGLANSRPAELIAIGGPSSGHDGEVIAERCPDQLKLPFALWTREAVAQLIADRYDIQVSVWTAGRYLKKWGFTPQKPLRRGLRAQSGRGQKWLREKYPAIKRRAKREKGEILWGGRDGLAQRPSSRNELRTKRPDVCLPWKGTTFSLQHYLGDQQSRAPSLHGFQTTVYGQGDARLPAAVDSARRSQSVSVVDGHPVHKSKKVKQWLEQHTAATTKGCLSRSRTATVSAGWPVHRPTAGDRQAA